MRRVDTETGSYHPYNYFFRFFNRIFDVISHLFPREIQEKFDWKIEFIDSNCVGLCTNPSLKIIYLPAGFLDCVWHMSYCNYFYYQWFLRESRSDEVKYSFSSQFFSDENVSRCIARVRFLFKNNTKAGNYDTLTPNPNFVLGKNPSMHDVASEIMLHTVGAGLLHEVYHILFFLDGKIAKSIGEAKEEEMNADEYASRVLLKVGEPEDRTLREKWYLKRYWSLAELANFLVINDFHTKNDEIHPDAISRLENFFAPHTNIFQLREANSISLENDANGKCIVGYVACCLNTWFQVLVPENSAEMKEYVSIIQNTQFETPLHFYYFIRNYVLEHMELLNQNKL